MPALFLELFLEKGWILLLVFLLYIKNKDMDKKTYYKRNYTNGYEQKVNYYLKKLDDEFQNEDVGAILYTKKKLDYFVDKQIEYLTKKQIYVPKAIRTAGPDKI